MIEQVSDQPPSQACSPPPPSQTTQLPPQAAQGGLDIANNWGLPFLAGGFLMGVISLFIGWTDVEISSSQDVSANGIDWITGIDWFDDDGFPWWLGLLALFSFIGVGLLGLIFLGNVVPRSPFPDAHGIGVLGALMLALSPMFTHVGFLLWVENWTGS